MMHKHLGSGSTVFISETYYDPSFIFWGEPDIVGGFRNKTVGVTWCSICGRLLGISNRRATLWERIKWRIDGGAKGKWWSKHFNLPSGEPLVEE